MSDSRLTVLPDGRELGWLEIGRPKGMPIFAFHGTPGSRYGIVIDEALVTKAGLRLICVDRPGYGLSTFQPGRRLIDWPRDVEYLADHLKSADWGARRAQFAAKVSAEVLAEVTAKLRPLLVL